ncbi:MAG: hypothetical protein OSA98_23795, partial [Rubripirellula sp.]|nr:hypothetical protein [Rubripirellula sp.]
TILTSAKKSSLAIFCVELAHALASKVDGRVSRSRTNLAASATDQTVRIQSEDVDEPVNASRAVSPVHRPPDAIDIAGCCVVARERGTHDAPRLYLAPNGYAWWTLCVDGVEGLPVSLGGLLEDLPIESLLSDHLLQPCVLFLQSLQLPGHLWLHATLLLPPAIIGLFTDFE